MEDSDWSTLLFSEVESETDFIFETKKPKIYNNKQSFSDNWLTEEQFSGWLEKVENQPYKAKCNVCNKLLRAKHHNLRMHKETNEHQMKSRGMEVSSSNKSTFVDKWLEEDQFKGWLQKCDDIFKARCKFCCKCIRTKRYNLISHLKSETHKNNALINSEEPIEDEEFDLEEIEAVYLDEERSQSSLSSSDESSSSSEKPKRKYPQNFRKEWLDCPKYKDWLQEDENNEEKCICKCCNKTLGAKKSNLESHYRSKNHQRLIKSKRIQYSQKFRDEWLELKQFKNWLERIDDDLTSAFCSVCNIRLRAKKYNLDDHCRRAHHKRIIQNPNLEILPSYSQSDKQNKYVFSKKWLNDADFSDWLKMDENNPGMVICTICKRQLTATKHNLKIHAKSRTHIWRLEQENSLKGFFSNFTGS